MGVSEMLGVSKNFLSLSSCPGVSWGVTPGKVPQTPPPRLSEGAGGQAEPVSQMR